MKRQLSLSEWRLVSRIGFTSLILSAFALAVAVPGLVFGSIFMGGSTPLGLTPPGLNSSGVVPFTCPLLNNCSLIRTVNQIHPFEQDMVLIGGNGITISGGPHSLTIDASISLMVPPEFNVTFEMGQMYFNKVEQEPHTVWTVGSVRGLPEFRRLEWSDLPRLNLIGGDDVVITVVNESTFVIDVIDIDVHQVGLSAPSDLFLVTSPPVTDNGTLVFETLPQAPRTAWMGPVASTAGVPSFRLILPSDLPLINASTGISGILPVNRGGTGSDAALLDGQFWIGRTGSSPIPGYLTAAPGAEIIVVNSPGGIQLALGDALSITDLSVSGSTFLGANTTCVNPIHASCYDISGQSCAAGPLNSNCFPLTVQYDSVTVNTLTVLNSTILGTVLNQEFLNVTNLIADTFTLAQSMTCPGNSSISQDCFDISGKICNMGIPISESCIPASLVFYDLDVTHNLTVNNVQCNGGPLQDSCIPTRVARINGLAGLDFNIQASGAGIQVNTISGGVEVINTVANTPQAAHLVYSSTGGLPGFRALEWSDLPNISLPSELFAVSDAVNGTLTASLVPQAPHAVFAGPGPSFRVLEASDLPVIQGFGGISVNSSGGFINITGNYLSFIEMPSSEFLVTNGNLVTKKNQSKNTFWAGPSTGLNASPEFRLLSPNDLIPFNMTNGQLLIGSSGNAPSVANLVAGANIVLTQGPGSIVISATPDGVGGNGTVVSVGLSAPTSLFQVTGSPITEMGTLGLSLLNQPANHVFAGGSPPAFRALVPSDLPYSAGSGIQISPTGVISNTHLNLPPLGNGQFYIGAGGTPVAAGLSAGTGITITPGPGTVVISAMGSGAISSQEVIGTGMVSTTSSTYVLVPSMTVTPAAGTYIVSFSASGVLELGSADAKCALFKNGVIIAHTERRFGWEGGVQTSGFEVALHTQGIITVSGTEPIQVRFVTSGGKFFSIAERSMILIRV